MTDSRVATFLSTSPAQRSSIDRPVFPWASPSSLRSAHRNSETSLDSSGSVPVSASWDPRVATRFAASSPWPGSMSRQNPGSIGAMNQTFQDDSTRQWTFMGFEWIVRDVSRLRNFIEGLNSTETSQTSLGTTQQEDFEVLRLSPIISNRFKLEIAPVPVAGDGEDEDSELRSPKLSLYLTSLMMEREVAHEMPTSLMAAIKSPSGRGARPNWVWEHWSDWVFRQESEVWECPMPPLSSLLDTSGIADSDSFTICLQIHAPVGPLYPQQPDAYYVPKDLLDGIEASLDNGNTGDVQFICLEKFPVEGFTSPRSDNPHSRRSSSSSSSTLPSSRTTARKRIIYAHSDILIRRSEYFATMLNSSFAETTGNNPGERKLWRVVVEETDFQTMYWVLKYLYASYCVFKDHDDPRAAVEAVGTGWSAKWLHSRGDEWDWKSFPRSSSVDDSKSIASVDSIVSSGEVPQPVGSNDQAFRSSVTSTTSRTPGRPNTVHHTKTSTVSSGSRPSPSSPSVRKSTATGGGGETSSGVVPNPATHRDKGNVLPLSIPTSKYSPPHYPLSPRSQRNPSSMLPAPDPHAHPTPTPPGASALSIYQVAHRYSMPKLANLALEHIMATITPETSLALLLATSVWDELRMLIEEYVVQRWEEVSQSAEFERCLEEISTGEWGSEGGKTLTRLFRQLRSPVG